MRMETSPGPRPSFRGAFPPSQVCWVESSSLTGGTQERRKPSDMETEIRFGRKAPTWALNGVEESLRASLVVHDKSEVKAHAVTSKIEQ